MIDTETQKVLSEGDQLKYLTEQSGWGIVKRKLMDKIMDLGSVLGLDSTDPHKLAIEIAARQLATKILIDWFGEIEGKVDQHKANVDILNSLKDEYIIEVKP